MKEQFSVGKRHRQRQGNGKVTSMARDEQALQG